MSTRRAANIDTVRKMAKTYCSWNRWGPDDQLGTLNFVTPETVRKARECVRKGRVFSLSIPFDDTGPQTGGLFRFNPMHFMLRDGANAVVGNTIRDFFGGINKHTVGTDDVIMMPTHAATHWDALAHITFEGKIWNGYSATDVGDRGALRNDISKVRDRFVGRGVLLDMPRFVRVDWLEPGTPISGEELDACAAREGVALRSGDFVLIRTGQLAQVRKQGAWGSYAGGPAPGLGLDAVPWMYQREMAAVATDTWGVEVIPNETADVFQPLHILMIPIMGLTMGEMFDMEDLGADCAADGVYEFLFCAPPLRITGGVGSPVNPIVVK